MKKLISLIAVMTSLLFLGCGSETSTVSTAKETYKEGDKVELKSVSGAKLTLLRKNGGFVIEDDESKIVLIDIFGTFCVPCQEEAPSLMDFQLQNADDVMLIGLNYFEEVSDEYVVENFAAKYNAYYFITNSPKNKKIVETIVQDIAYKGTLQVPFKIVLKEGKYQKVTDIYNASNPENKFYIGKVGLDIIQQDIDKLTAK
ncbi:TlpA disulfide reductase family protein [Sulfurospirillum arsenophilum]|uniref:TlpA disulfide reductase family protein n=1 Tax=Sulfurospirillum arsenophilum TaxID=56698 RepID=UPI0005A88B31|nr:TlpA disulfide reductase family protein [Sulfurospirillum arsenophilum]